jgi:transcriptional regulator with XRE-family HTH domain
MTKIQKSLDTKEIGEKVRQLRKARSMRQDELGEVLGGLSRGQVSNLETGRRNLNIHQIKILADFFGVSLETLGLKTEEVEVNDLLARAKLIFENDTVPFEEKQELSEEIMKMYIIAKEQIKK